MKDSLKGQCSAILKVLLEAKGGEVPLPEITQLAAQYNARIWTLRRMGFQIENRATVVNGTKHSWFRLVVGQEANRKESEAAPIFRPIPQASDYTPQVSLFGNLSPQERHRDDG